MVLEIDHKLLGNKVRLATAASLNCGIVCVPTLQIPLVLDAFEACTALYLETVLAGPVPCKLRVVLGLIARWAAFHDLDWQDNYGR